MATLLIAGLPVAGKSTYCRWLVQEHGYEHLDSDAQRDDPIIVAVNTGDADAVRNATRLLRSFGPDVVLDWGFPSHWGDGRRGGG